MVHVAWQEDSLLERTVKRHHYFSVVGKRGSYGGTQLSRQNQKPHGKNKKHHGKTRNLTAKTKYLTAKTKYLTAKPNTSQQKQNSFGFALSICFCREVFGFCCEVFHVVFAVRSLLLPWGLVLPWGFRFCREVFWFCREVFGFAVTVVGHRRILICQKWYIMG